LRIKERADTPKPEHDDDDDDDDDDEKCKIIRE
jgi:hypothetical protein